MSFRGRFGIAAILIAGTLACGLISTPVPPTAAPPASVVAPTTEPTKPEVVASAAAATDTPAATEAAAPSDTPEAGSNGFLQFFSGLGDMSQYFNPVGQPAQEWNGIPVMPAAIAGQEYKPGHLYSFKANGTIAQATEFYQAKLPTLGYQLMSGPGTGSAGTGANAIHDSFLYVMKGAQTVVLYIASYDNDSSHVSVVIATP